MGVAMWIESYLGLDVALLPWNTNVFYVLLRAGEALAIDPPAAAPVQSLLGAHGAVLSQLLITHKDPDHVDGVDELVDAWHPPVRAPLGAPMDFAFEPVRDGDVLHWRELAIRVIDTRGHRRQHVAYHLPEPAPGLLFSGDSLFAGGCGRLNGQPPEWMYESLHKLAALPAETHLYCGHDYLEDNLRFALTVEPGNVAMQRRLDDVRARHRAGEAVLPSTLALEKETNPFLRARDVAAFAGMRRAKDSF